MQRLPGQIVTPKARGDHSPDQFDTGLRKQAGVSLADSRLVADQPGDEGRRGIHNRAFEAEPHRGDPAEQGRWETEEVIGDTNGERGHGVVKEDIVGIHVLKQNQISWPYFRLPAALGESGDP
ncbi:hypothetical protein Pka01_71590 [Planotetraspora kaengkrachanensis]|uniref:Uncharacterized protein n=1 Tax=Planotetraspora kaengkrachanensis TaxID=575193 RepID=A0A8J3PZM2_9ACTN|nr:hypothetical protein Pka01_71590 [Planotetraspora kaengkrachanensis]